MSNFQDAFEVEVQWLWFALHSEWKVLHNNIGHKHEFEDPRAHLLTEAEISRCITGHRDQHKTNKLNFTPIFRYRRNFSFSFSSDFEKWVIETLRNVIKVHKEWSWVWRNKLWQQAKEKGSWEEARNNYVNYTGLLR